MDIEGREGCFSADGRRHRNVGGRDGSATNTTGGADTAFHGAMLVGQWVVGGVGVVTMIAAACARVLM